MNLNNTVNRWSTGGNKGKMPWSNNGDAMKTNIKDNKEALIAVSRCWNLISELTRPDSNSMATLSLQPWHSSCLEHLSEDFKWHKGSQVTFSSETNWGQVSQRLKNISSSKKKSILKQATTEKMLKPRGWRPVSASVRSFHATFSASCLYMYIK